MLEVRCDFPYELRPLTFQRIVRRTGRRDIVRFVDDKYVELSGITGANRKNIAKQPKRGVLPKTALRLWPIQLVSR